ncbi:hypothetical protein tb265_49310 [Gemmatimonadetes bacterium T265]|nr:hypothetical protein tb265_49310 [Gemmatimonadetes bacterium T265]
MRAATDRTGGALHAGAPEGGAGAGTPATVRPFPTRPRVVAWLTARERAQVDAGAGGIVALSHRETLAAVGEDLTRGLADAVLLSTARLTIDDRPTLAAYVGGFPAVAFAGLVTPAADERQALAAAHLLGEVGVPALLDCRGPGGWTALRGTFAPRRLPEAVHRACVTAVLASVYGDVVHARGAGGPALGGLARFFALAFAPDVARARTVAERLGMCPQTLTSRFFRAGLPSPKRYVAWARLVWAAHLGEARGLTVQALAERVDASSPQAFARNVRRLTGTSPGAFRRGHTGAEMLARYVAALVTPYGDRLRTFDPLGAAVPRHPDRRPAVDRMRRAA